MIQKKMHHTALLAVHRVHLLEQVVVLQSMCCCYALETNCIALHYAMPIATMRIAVQSQNFVGIGSWGPEI